MDSKARCIPASQPRSTTQPESVFATQILCLEGSLDIRMNLFFEDSPGRIKVLQDRSSPGFVSKRNQLQFLGHICNLSLRRSNGQHP